MESDKDCVDSACEDIACTCAGAEPGETYVNPYVAEHAGIVDSLDSCLADSCDSQ